MVRSECPLPGVHSDAIVAGRKPKEKGQIRIIKEGYLVPIPPSKDETISKSCIGCPVWIHGGSAETASKSRPVQCTLTIQSQLQLGRVQVWEKSQAEVGDEVSSF